MKIVNTDNFGGDYPNEKALSLTDSDGRTFIFHSRNEKHAQTIANLLNEQSGGTEAFPASRYWTVKPDDYALQPGFEP